MQVGSVGINQNYNDYKYAYAQKNAQEETLFQDNVQGKQKMNAYYEFQNSINSKTKEISEGLSDENLQKMVQEQGVEATEKFIDGKLNELDELDKQQFNYLQSEEIAKTPEGKIDTAKYIENGKPFAEALFTDWNTNGDNGISYDEYYAYEFRSYEEDVDKNAFDNCVASMFKTYDLNNDGSISQDEIQSYHVAADMADGTIDGNISVGILTDASVQEELKKGAQQFQNFFMK